MCYVASTERRAGQGRLEGRLDGQAGATGQRHDGQKRQPTQCAAGAVAPGRAVEAAFEAGDDGADPGDRMADGARQPVGIAEGRLDEEGDEGDE